MITPDDLNLINRVFHTEGPQFYGEAYAQNSPYATPGPYRTRLNPHQERRFRQWVQSEGVPFNPRARVTDYDMRGYWLARSRRGLPVDYQKGAHFPDKWKTPYGTTFSSESMYATPNNPFVWRGEQLVNKLTGEVVYSPGRTRG